MGVADHTALPTAQGDIDNRALPGHPGRQRTHRVDRLLGVKADTTLGRATSIVVLHPVSLEDPDRAVIHLHRNGEMKLALRPPEELADPLVELQLVGHGIKLPLRHLERVELFRHIRLRSTTIVCARALYASHSRTSTPFCANFHKLRPRILEGGRGSAYSPHSWPMLDAEFWMLDPPTHPNKRRDAKAQSPPIYPDPGFRDQDATPVDSIRYSASFRFSICGRRRTGEPVDRPVTRLDGVGAKSSRESRRRVSRRLLPFRDARHR